MCIPIIDDVRDTIDMNLIAVGYGLKHLGGYGVLQSCKSPLTLPMAIPGAAVMMIGQTIEAVGTVDRGFATLFR